MEERLFVKNVGSGVFLLSLSVGEEGGWSGCLEHLYQKEPFYFSDLTQAVLKMEEILEEYLPPRSNAPMRTFVKAAKKRESSAPAPSVKGQKERFYIRVYYRQNNSWQGELRWQNRKQSMCFRSVLELLELLDSAFIRSKAAFDAAPATL